MSAEMDQAWLDMLLDNFTEEELEDIFLIPEDTLKTRREQT